MVSKEEVNWAYQLFLDRKPENLNVVEEKAKIHSNIQELRKEFLNSEEFKKKNPICPVLSMSGTEPPMLIENNLDLNDSNVNALFSHIQDVWEYLGQTEPHWSVTTQEQFKSYAIKENLSHFYESGFENANTLFKSLDRNAIDQTSFTSCLEYGCGLGRVTWALSKKFERVIGYDISKSHLQCAKSYFASKGINNVELHHISQPQEIRNFPKVDVVYSVIVLQHNPPSLIYLILQELIRALNPGGIAFFQVPTYKMGYKFFLKDYLMEDHSNKEMEMHCLPQSEIFKIIHNENAKVIEILEDDWQGLEYHSRSNTFIVQKE